MASSDGMSIIVTFTVISNLELTQATAVGTLGTRVSASSHRGSSKDMVQKSG